MKMRLYSLNLPLEHPFRISRGVISNQPSLIVQLEHEGICGFGEVTENSFYGHTFQSMTESFKLIHDRIDAYIDTDPRQLWDPMFEGLRGDCFAMSALDMAAHDWYGKKLAKPTWQVWGLTWKDCPESSFTIGIDTIATMIDKLQEKPDWGIYKIKLGTSHDIEIVQELRNHTSAVFRVDANCGWSADQTIAYSHRLAELGVEFIEQPLAIDTSQADKRRVFEEAKLPIIADEDCQTLRDVTRCVGLYHGINVKICKCGGLSPALRMLGEARSLGMKTMVGCMVESPIGISGAAQLLPLLDYADLDGAVLLRDAPAFGTRIDRGKVVLSNTPGCGGNLDQDKLDDFLVNTIEF